MDDDFDLFPKRENLDPFSFGKKEKTTEPDKADSEDELFGHEEQAPGSLPDLPTGLSPDHLSPGAPEITPPPPDLPIDIPETVMPPLEPPPPPDPVVAEAAPDLGEGVHSEGPISADKTFDEPVFEQEQYVEEKGEKRSRKTPSPFVVVGGAIIIIIGLLYGALTYLKKDKPAVPMVSAPPVSVPIAPPRPEPVPVPESGTEVAQGQAESSVPEATQTAEGEPSSPEAAQAEPVQETAAVITESAPEPEPSLSPVPVVATGGVQYSVQVGAFILDSSVAELEKKIRGLGYDPILKKGSTTAMMNMLTVGPFGSVNDARAALTRLQGAGVDSNLRRRNDGSAVINAGSYLLEENATSIMKKVRSLGYPVKLAKKEARLPMTFVRVGRYSGMDDATSAKVELKGKGLDGIVVKLQ